MVVLSVLLSPLVNGLQVQCTMNFYATLVVLFCVAAARTPPEDHVHGEINKERPEDGTPAKHEHYSDEGDHYDEYDHEAILGTRKAVEEFEELSTEEAQTKLREIVEKMDVDNDKSVSESELTEWILNSFVSLSQEDSAERFEEVDVNNDGRVTWEEVLEEFGIYDEPDLEKIADEEPELKIELDESIKRFKIADKDGDGVLSIDEYFPFSNPEESPEMHDSIILENLRQKDTDNDGRISFEEYLSDADSAEDYLATEKSMFDNDYDKNKDGYLDKDEMILWLIPDNKEQAIEEARHLISNADMDKDGRLSFSEILDNYRMFVSSKDTESHEGIRDEL